MEAINHVSSDERRAYTGPVPGLAIEICNLARAKNLEAQLFSNKHSDIAILVRGAESGFRSAGFVRPEFRFPVRYREIKDGAFGWTLNRIDNHVFEGEMFVEAPSSMRMMDDLPVEELLYQDREDRKNRRALWGNPTDVEYAAGLRRGTLAPGRHSKKCGRGNGREWSAVYLPSGNVHYLVQEMEPCARDMAREKALDALIAGFETGPLYLGTLYCDVYIGTKEQLLTANVCAPEAFPGGARRSSSGSLRHDDDDERHWSMTYLRRGYFEFRVQKSKVEIAAGDSSANRRGPEYESPEAYLPHARMWVERGINIIQNISHGLIEKDRYGETTLVLDRAALDSIDDALEQIEAAMRLAAVRWTDAAAARRRELAAAKADPRFRRFLGGLGIDGPGSPSIH